MIYYCRVSQDEDCFVVEFPEVAGVLTYGESTEEALSMATDALNLMLASMVEDGAPLPKSKIRKGAGYFSVEVNPSIVAAAEIRQARKAAGLTQKQMAARLKVANCLGHSLKLAI